MVCGMAVETVVVVEMVVVEWLWNGWGNGFCGLVSVIVVELVVETVAEMFVEWLRNNGCVMVVEWLWNLLWKSCEVVA